jgi:hypothetical protein
MSPQLPGHQAAQPQPPSTPWPNTPMQRAGRVAIASSRPPQGNDPAAPSSCLRVPNFQPVSSTLNDSTSTIRGSSTLLTPATVYQPIHTDFNAYMVSRCSSTEAEPSYTATSTATDFDTPSSCSVLHHLLLTTPHMNNWGHWTIPPVTNPPYSQVYCSDQHNVVPAALRGIS